MLMCPFRGVDCLTIVKSDTTQFTQLEVLNFFYFHPKKNPPLLRKLAFESCARHGYICRVVPAVVEA